MREVGRISGSRAFAALKPAAFLGRLWFGPSIGQRAQFTHPRTWLGRPARQEKVDAEPAAATIMRQYLAARLLPAFDPYVAASSRHAQELLPGDLRSRVFRPQGWISPVLLVDSWWTG